MATAQKSEIFSGPAEVTIDGTSVGVVGDCRVAIERPSHDETGEPFGSQPHSMFREGTRVRVTVPMKQTVAELLAIAIDGDNQSGVVYFEDRPGRATEHELVLTAVQGKAGVGGIDAVANELKLYKVVAEDGITEAVYSRTEERMYEVTFANVLDTARSAGRRIGYWKRPAAS